MLESHRATVMGTRLMLIRGRIQKSDNVIHVVANTIEDKTSWLALLTEDGALLKNLLAHAVAKPGPELYNPTARHPGRFVSFQSHGTFH